MVAVIPKNTKTLTLNKSLRIFFDHQAATPEIDIIDRAIMESSFKMRELKVISST
tara:strand:- start:106 stop:270 length:165 start_codon:yes stop_codon:yes gene_type:complete